MGEELSDRAIAEHIGCSPTTVGKYRDDSGVQSGHQETRTGRDGKEYDPAKHGTSNTQSSSGGTKNGSAGEGPSERRGGNEIEDGTGEDTEAIEHFLDECEPLVANLRSSLSEATPTDGHSEEARDRLRALAGDLVDLACIHDVGQVDPSTRGERVLKELHRQAGPLITKLNELIEDEDVDLQAAVGPELSNTMRDFFMDFYKVHMWRLKAGQGR